MPADLQSASGFSRQSILLRDDHIAFLEPRNDVDRVKRVQYDQITSVAISSSLPWLIMSLIAGIALLIVFLTLIASGPFAIILVTIVISAVLLGISLINRVFKIRITTHDRKKLIKSFATPGKVERFRKKLLAKIQETESRLVSPQE